MVDGQVQVAADASQVHFADRIDDHVPMFKEDMLPASRKALAGECATFSAAEPPLADNLDDGRVLSRTKA